MRFFFFKVSSAYITAAWFPDLPRVRSSKPSPVHSPLEVATGRREPSCFLFCLFVFDERYGQSFGRMSVEAFIKRSLNKPVYMAFTC